MRGGRARWKVENETINTLKNQGYQFEHNFGHGSKDLCQVLATLMMLAFLTDELQFIACRLMKLAKEKKGSKKSLWQKIRSAFDFYLILSWEDLLKVIAFGWQRLLLLTSQPVEQVGQ